MRRAESLLLLFAMIFAFFSGLMAPRATAANAGWKQADRPRTWRFPRDHGAHSAYRTEWWYFTGNLNDDEGGRYGFQLTFFREGVSSSQADHGNPWSLRDLYLAHFAVTDISRKLFVVDERASRAGPGLAGASADRLHVWVLSWRASSEGDRLLIEATSGATELSLDLTPLKPLVLHGNKGLSRKGNGQGQASYYVSYTDLRATGRLLTPGLARPVRVRGVGWFDHEFGSSQLTPGQAGWDWFGLHLSDGKDLMLYFLRRTDGSVEPASSGTIVDRSGAARHLTLSQVRVDILDHWRSPKTKGIYPSRWRVRIPSEGLDLTYSPLLADQELLTPQSTGVTYWEGAVEGQGLSGNRRITCLGYAELTGYVGKLGGLF